MIRLARKKMGFTLIELSKKTPEMAGRKVVWPFPLGDDFQSDVASDG